MPLLPDFGVTRVARHTGLDCIGIPVWCAYAPNARSIVVAQGKGLSDDDAKVSAVMEGLERAVAGSPYCATILATAGELQASGHKVVTLNSLVALHQSEIGLDEVIEWTIANELLSDTAIHVPFEAALLDRTRCGRFWMSSDGLASGNNLEEATLHGILERIERDAYVLWQVSGENFRHSRCVDPLSFGDRVLDDLLRRVDAAGLRLKLFDITSDIAVPCFTALLGPATILSGTSIRFVEVTAGSGAHPSAVRAAIRAVTESVQSRLTYISGARDDISPETFQMQLPDETRRCFAAKPNASIPCVSAEPGSLQGLLSGTLDALRRAAIDVVAVLALSDPSLPFSVAKVFIPALENPAGSRARRYGSRAISRALMS
jgi:ribosomal protein S12 methylthiotransferase accessory factor